MLKYFGYVRMVREVFPYMQKQHKGVILNVIGMGGFMPSAKYMPGGAINAACNHFTKALGEEGSNHGIRVVGINPGAVLTERLWRQLKARSGTDDLGEALKMYNPLGRAAQPEEVADLALFLVSDRAEYIHATNVTIDGGGGHITLVN
jgi:NAD(P)-dependent dehydrogenase (short-subunit alcohol dehydrogenase family)